MSTEKQVPTLVPEGAEEELDTSKPQAAAAPSGGFTFDFSGSVPQGGFGSMEDAYAMFEAQHGPADGADEEHDEEEEEVEVELDEDALMEQLERAFAAQLRMQGIEPPENLQEHLLEFLARDMGLMGDFGHEEDEEGDHHHHHGGCSHDHDHDHEHHHHGPPQFVYRRAAGDDQEDEHHHDENEDDVYDEEEFDDQHLDINEQDLLNMLMQQMMGGAMGQFVHREDDEAHAPETAEEEDCATLEEVEEQEE